MGIGGAGGPNSSFASAGPVWECPWHVHCTHGCRWPQAPGEPTQAEATESSATETGTFLTDRPARFYNMTPARDLKQWLLRAHLRGGTWEEASEEEASEEEASGRRHVGGGIWEESCERRHLGGGIWDEASGEEAPERRLLEGGTREETSGRKHLGGGILRRHPGGIKEAPRRHSGDTQEAPRRYPQASLPPGCLGGTKRTKLMDVCSRLQKFY